LENLRESVRSRMDVDCSVRERVPGVQNHVGQRLAFPADVHPDREHRD